jgi:hypothetical protein
MVNLGIWQGFLMAAGLPYVLVHPATWQTAHQLRNWQARIKQGTAGQHSPLSLARQLWPTAPLDYQADDGKAVGLLLADLARRDRFSGIDRAAIQARAAEKKQTKKRALRQARKQNILSLPPDATNDRF